MYGCMYEVSKTKRWNKKTKQYDDVPVHCLKLTPEDSVYCPKHKLFVEDDGKAGERLKAKREQDREYKREYLESLRNSPLAAVNPAFDDSGKRLTGYEV